MMAWWMTCVVMQINTHTCIYVRTCSGTVAGVYVGVEYGIDKIRGHRDWVGIHLLFIYLFALRREAHKLKNINNK